MSQKLTLQQRLQQKLSPQQIMLMKLMQVPAMSLEQRIKEEIENNPALEMNDDENDNYQQDHAPEEDFNNNDEKEQERGIDSDNEFSMEDYMDEDDIPDYRLYSNNHSYEESKEIPMASGKSFHEYLLEQLSLRDLNETDFQIALQIIGNIDDAGYLARDIESIVDDLSFMKNIHVSEHHVAEILHVIQDFDPAGISARDLRECLLLQLHRKTPTPTIEKATVVIDKYFNEFSKKHYERILQRTGMNEQELKEVIAEILKLNPKPGDYSVDSYTASQSIIPDFTVNVIGDTLDVQLNSHNTPELYISKDYQEMLELYSKNEDSKSNNNQNKEAAQFVRNRIDAARWFIDAIRQRQNTLLSVMTTIAQYQKEYFTTGDESRLHPMILKDIAEALNMDVSTISRVVSSKYVQTPFETFLLKNLFSESFQNDEGEEISTKEIKQALKKLVDEEDKSAPLTDDKLLTLLKEKGYGVARRTVAKYREQLNIPPSRLRKEL
ncbi:MAG: RNA polymerase factor sigma-54 [Bacteroidales bacterium]|jgi:RNA polymerase sigma-54 factor|nr:RNA polymerase factor sigma-54 [Bacteroidales bacterium]